MPLAKMHHDSSAGLVRTSLSHLLWRYEFKITLTGRRVKAACNSARMASAVAATASGGLLHLASFHTSADHSTGYVSLHPRKSFTPRRGR